MKAQTAARLPPPAGAPSPTASTLRVAPSPRLLIVDGSKISRTAELQAATAAGCQCSTVDSIEAAIASLEAQRPALVLLDSASAWSQGPEAFSRLKHPKYGDLPVVLVADSSTPAELIEECWKWGIDDCLLRPVRAADLKARFEAVDGGERAAPDPRTERNARRILVVDGDDPIYAERLGRLLELNGYRLLHARAGAKPGEIAAACEQGPIELLVLLTRAPAAEQRALVLEAPSLGERAVFVLADAPAPADAGVAQLAGWLDRREVPPEAVVQRVNVLFEAPTRNLKADQRVPFFCPVEFREWGTTQTAWTSAFSFNVSAGGIFVRTLVPARPRAALELRIHLTTTREELPATGVVAWANRYSSRRVFSYPVGMGVQFLGMPLSKRLAHLIEICRSAGAT